MSISSEVKSVRNNAGLIDLSHRGKLKLSGKEHLNLLQGMLTNDVIKLKKFKGLYATSLTAKGKIIADMRLHKLDDNIILDLESHISKKFRQYLLKYKLSYKVDIEDLTRKRSLFHLCGPNSTEVLKRSFNLGQDLLDEFDLLKLTEQSRELLVAKINRTGETGYDIYADEDKGSSLWLRILKSNSTYGLKPFKLETMDTLRIEAGIPILGKDMDENTIPIESGLWNALNFEKGCYIGQEIIARIKWRGNVAKHLVGFNIEGDKNVTTPGCEVFAEDKKVGWITSSTYSPTFERPIALGYIKRGFNKEGLSVDIENSEAGYVKATVADLPFIDNFT